MYEQAQPAGGVDSIVGDEARQAAAAIIRESPDAFALYNAMSGLGTDEDAVWSVLETREDSIPSLYQEYGALMSRLKMEASGFESKLKKYGTAFLVASPLIAIAASQGAVADAIKQTSKTPAKIGRKADNALIAMMPHNLLGRLMGKERKVHKGPQDRVAGETAGPLEFNLGMASTIPKAVPAMKTGIMPGILGGAAVASIMAIIDAMGVMSYSDDLITWLEDDGMDDAAAFVRDRM